MTEREMTEAINALLEGHMALACLVRELMRRQPGGKYIETSEGTEIAEAFHALAKCDARIAAMPMTMPEIYY